jgi:hypothetical protein
VDWQRHGQTGFGWAAQREVLADGLYDRAIGGGGDQLMAHAFAGDWESECARVIMPPNAPYEADYRAWCAKVYPHVRGRLGFVEGHVLHLWHGSLASRRYRDRSLDLAALEYDPSRDIRLGRKRCWEWTGRNPALERWCLRYFDGRKANHPSAETSISRRDIIRRIGRYRDRAENAQLRFWVDAATSAERAVLRAPTIAEAREVADDFFDWCTDEAES